MTLMKLVRKSLDNNREKKLKIDYKIVEKITQEFLDRWDIDNIVESRLYTKLQNKIDWDQVLINLKVGPKKQKLQFDEELFEELTKEVTEIYNEYKKKEILYLKENRSQYEAEQFRLIFDNVMDTIPLTMFETGVNRMTLVSYHYLTKVITRLAEQFMQTQGIKNVNGTKNPTEIFINEFYNLIANTSELTKFTITIKSLIEQWLGKYNAKTKISDFYFSILMITPDVIIEKILKYMLFTAIRNKNPFVLRAIFSSYLTLIHKNLFSFYATNLTKVKVGYFKQLEGLFTENFDLIFDQGKQNDPKKFIMNSMIFNYFMRNKKYLKNNFSFISDDYTQNFLEPNYFDVFSSYRKNSEIPFMDHMYFYTTNLKYTKNSIIPEGNYYKISSDFFKKNVLKRNKLLLMDLLYKHIGNYFYIYFQDKEIVETIIENIAKDLSQKLNLEHYLTEDFKQLEFSYDVYLNTIEKFIFLMKKAFDDTSIMRHNLGARNEIPS